MTSSGDSTADGSSPDDGSATAAAAAAAEPSSTIITASSSSSSSASCSPSPSSYCCSTTYIGIDFGTSNSAAAVWDSSRGHPKWMRLGCRKHLATSSSGSSKAGRIVPSAVLFVARSAIIDEESSASNNTSSSFLPRHYEDVSDILGRSDVVAYVGAAAMQLVEQAFAATKNEKSWSSSSSSSSSSFLYNPQQVSAALVTSVKRILGMKKSHDASEKREESWIQSLPFELVNNDDKDDKSSSTNKEEEDDGGAFLSIRVHPLGMNDTTSIVVTPTQVVAIILRSIRLAAQEYLKKNMVKKRLKVPGSTWQCTNCVLGVPAHWGQAQRQTLLRAAKLAGFDHDTNDTNNNSNNTKVVSVLTESTAAAMAYGLFVSTGGSSNSEQETSNGASATTTTTTTTKKKSILVFDMGGGTTDVTIAEMSSSKTDTDDTDSSSSALPRFDVKVTQGDSHLGGDDMDEALLRTVLSKLKQYQSNGSRRAISSLLLSPSEHRSLLRQCRSAKERLCGDVDHGLTKPEECVTITTPVGNHRVDITQHDLDQALQPCLERAEQVVQRALDRYAALHPSSSSEMTTQRQSRLLISEVVLVGGATRVLSVRNMLKRLFPPPPDLCLSVNAMSAVAQGTAIKAAMDSKCIPLHELRSAMMLDTTPHAIGVLLLQEASSDGDPPTFVELIPRDEPLPASGVATFQLAHASQPGVSLTAVEKVVDYDQHSDGKGKSPRFLYPKLGDFTFLLHRLSEGQVAELKDGIRSVDICMTLQENGALVVSYVDLNDPEHVARRQEKKKRRRSKRDATTAGAVLDYVDVDAAYVDQGFSKEQWILIGYCVILLVLYVVAKVFFHEELQKFKVE